MKELHERIPETTEPAALVARLRQPEADLPTPRVSQRSAEPNEHQTEAAGWEATWMFDHGLIRIVLVRNTSNGADLIRADNPATAPDLAQLRDRFPHLSPLWDAIRHQFWTETLGPGTHPHPAHHD